MNSDFSRADSKHHKGPVNCYIFTRIYPIYLLSSGVIIADGNISIVVFNLFLTWSGYNRCRSLFKADSDKVIANDSKDTMTLITHLH